MGQPRYTDIERWDFIGFITQYGFVEDEKFNANEYVFRRNITTDGSIFVRVFSSVNKRTGHTRAYKKDAIRVVVRVEQSNLKYTLWNGPHVKRVDTWKTNLEKRIAEALRQVGNRPCPKCGSLMILRNGSRGEFYGCSMFAKTRCNGTRQA